MVKYGVVKQYNNEFGLIESEGKIVDFSKEDISLNENIQINDFVCFRVEIKDYDILIARNIKVINKLHESVNNFGSLSSSVDEE